MNKKSDQYTEDETARRRDEVVRRMANTPPQPKATTPHRPKKKADGVAGLIGAATMAVKLRLEPRP